MRADRLISILLLLQIHKHMTAHQLATRLEVSERTIHRDMEALSTSGVPVTAERGVGGGWSLLDSYRVNLTGLNQTEVQTLFLGKPTQLLNDLGLHDASESALIKLLAALPRLSRHNAEYARQRILIDTSGWHHAEENVACLPLLQEAIWQERKLRFTYQRSNDTLVERCGDPLGLVAKGSIWYLVAAIEGELRTYRASRIRDVAILDEAALRPPAFDLATYWEQSTIQFKAQLPRYEATIRAHADTLSWIRYTFKYAHIEQKSQPDEHGWITLNIQFETEEEACQYILGLGIRAEVLEPRILRERVVYRAQEVLLLYTHDLSKQ